MTINLPKLEIDFGFFTRSMAWIRRTDGNGWNIGWCLWSPAYQAFCSSIAIRLNFTAKTSIILFITLKHWKFQRKMINIHQNVVKMTMKFDLEMNDNLILPIYSIWLTFCFCSLNLLTIYNSIGYKLSADWMTVEFLSNKQMRRKHICVAKRRCSVIVQVCNPIQNHQHT